MSSVESHECKDCETIFESKEELDKHIEEKHSEIEWDKQIDVVVNTISVWITKFDILISLFLIQSKSEGYTH